MAEAATRQYEATAKSTDTFGRVLWNVRDHYFVADGPVANGCPGIAVSPGEMFLAGIASCAVDLIEVLARRNEAPLDGVDARIRGVMGGGAGSDKGVTLFDSVHLQLNLRGVSRAQAAELVHGFKAM